MELQGERLIPASVDRTWAALNDPAILKACIAGCESLERAGEDQFDAMVAVKVGPVNARFKAKLKLSDVQAPTAYTIHFDGQGGVAGHGRGSAAVALAPEGSGTRLSYTAKAQVGGKLAQIGSRLVDAAAQKVANDFFAAFNAKLAAEHPQAGHGDHDGHEDHDAHHPEPIPRDPALPDVTTGTLAFFAAGALVVVAVALLTLL